MSIATFCGIRDKLLKILINKADDCLYTTHFANAITTKTLQRENIKETNFSVG